ncbi:MAG: hypothetical protein HY812_09390 [Planctomycetes bacterium]|nr:hypothetical protein [Planctomycetota bacterium]
MAVEVSEGTTGDTQTATSAARRIRERLRPDQAVIVGDCDVLTEARIPEDRRSHEGISWITALRFPAIRRPVRQCAIQRSLFDEQDLAEVHSPDYPGVRLMACRSPLSAAERRGSG